jgi:UDP-N-acetylglucosamine diphosphorylase/glucosamine-1-phosphate N-acetyltransferase
MRVCLFEDQKAADLEPLSLTRPVFELLCGWSTLGSKQRRYFGAPAAGALVRPHLADLHRLQAPHTPVNDGSWLQEGPTILVNGRWLPPSGVFGQIAAPCLGLCSEEIAYAAVEPGHLATLAPDNLDEHLQQWKRSLPCHQVAGRVVQYLWELVQHNGGQIVHDWQTYLLTAPLQLPSGQRHSQPAVVGPARQLWVDPSARLDPLIVVDTTGGPVIVEEEAVIGAFTRLEGPCVIGPGTHVLGAKVRAGTTLGPCCRVGGEVEASIIQGHSNKYHDGFLGHAYVGEWVNLGAGTQNSDLRNDYGEVTVTVNGRPVRTGMNKVGCYLGDHTKAGLATLLNTGTNAGVFCNLLPGGLLPRYVPSFASWWNQALTDRADLDQLFKTAAEVMRRRGAVVTEAHAALYRFLYEQTAPERRRVVREAELRQLRRSA